MFKNEIFSILSKIPTRILQDSAYVGELVTQRKRKTHMSLCKCQKYKSCVPQPWSYHFHFKFHRNKLHLLYIDILCYFITVAKIYMLRFCFLSNDWTRVRERIGKRIATPNLFHMWKNTILLYSSRNYVYGHCGIFKKILNALS